MSLQIDQIRSILVAPSTYFALGDTVVAIAYLRQLRVAFPNVRLGILTRKNISIYQFAQCADEYISPTAMDVLEQYHRWDLFINCSYKNEPLQFIVSRYLAKSLVLVNETYYFDTTAYPINETENCYVTHLKTGSHVLDYLSQSILGRYLPEPVFYLPPNPLCQQIATEIWQPNKLRVLLSPIGNSRMILVEEFAKILQGINPNIMAHLDLVTAPTAFIKDYLNELQQQAPTLNVRLTSELKVEEYVALVESSDFVISVDTSTVHLATSYQKPLAAFYANCQSNIDKWKPRPINHTPTLMAIGAHIATTGDELQDFDHPTIIHWINKQLEKLIANR